MLLSAELKDQPIRSGPRVLPKLAVLIAADRGWPCGNATITIMDRDWMRERLEEFRGVCEDYARSSEGAYVGDPRIRARVFRLEPTAKAVLWALDPDLANFNLDTMAGEYEGINPGFS